MVKVSEEADSVREVNVEGRVCILRDRVHWKPGVTETIYFFKDHSDFEECIVVRQEWKQRGQ